MTFSHEDAMNDAIKNCTVYEQASEEEISDSRTFSYISENGEEAEGDDDDEMSEPEIAASIDKSQKNQK